ncbi:hypothetical protein EV401DRAFT_2064695 [Pisolithus croceorrhizus]|nr:hypothetical protein EV401DRAFT_2064695 [Pisolithus croceorrhizus]
MSSTPDSAASARRVTRSQTTGRPTIRWGKYSKDDDDDPDAEQEGSSSLKRSFDASAVDEDTDVDGEQDLPYMPSKMPKMEPTLLLSASSSATAIEDPDPSHMQTRMMTPRPSSAGEYTFLDASSSSFTSERRGPRIRTAPPVPVPNLTKKSRGRRVPTAEDTPTTEGDTDSKKNRVYVCKVEDCGKCFSRGEHLKRHIRSIHTHEKPFKCPHPSCDKRFNPQRQPPATLARSQGRLVPLRLQWILMPAAQAEQSTSAESPSTANNSQRTTGRTSTTRRSSRPVRKTKSAASTPPIPAARLAAARASERSLPVSLPRTYSLPPLPSLATPYHTPSTGFMNNTNIAVSSLRTAIDESDGEPETEDTDGEARGSHSIQTLYSFARDLPKESFRGSVYSGTEPDQPEPRSDDVGEGSNVRQHDEHASYDNTSAKSESASSPYYPEASASRAPTEEATGLSATVSSATSPLPSAVSA